MRKQQRLQVMAAALAGVIIVPSLAMAELSAVIVRSVTMGTGQFSHFARGGLASDGICLCQMGMMEISRC
jgi:hypothetical protein